MRALSYLLGLLACLGHLEAWIPLSSSAFNNKYKNSCRLPASLAGVSVERFHSDESKRKISLANKGRAPWNVGLRHSNETKHLIAIRTREAALQRKINEALSLGLSVEELKSASAAKRKVLYEARLKGGLSEEGRKVISETMKARWSRPGYREEYSHKCAGTRGHSTETRARISEAVRRKWQDEDYRRRCLRTKVSPDTRRKISQRIKEKWTDPAYRQQMAASHVRTPEWRANLAAAIREKWQDPVYRVAVSRTRRARTGTGRTRKPAGSLQRGELVAESLSREEMQRRARLAARLAVQRNVTVDLQSLLGPELWQEEKEYRRSLGEEVPGDAALNAVLLRAWGHCAAEGRGEAELELELPVVLGDLLRPPVGGAGQPGGAKKGQGRRKDPGQSSGGVREGHYADEEGYGGSAAQASEQWDGADMNLDLDLGLDLQEEEDVIEEYDESGRLVGVYPAREFEHRWAEREQRV